MGEIPSAVELAQTVVAHLAAGQSVEIDGLGVFLPDPVLGWRFEAEQAPRVFIAYVKEDAAIAARLYDELAAAGYAPWMDTAKLLPGQNWPRAIENAIDTSDFFVACFSNNSVSKRGGFQSEIRYALDCARRVPLDEIFMVPLRLDECRVPRAIQREIQYLDAFPDWPKAMRRLRALLRRESSRRGRALHQACE